LGYNKRMEDFFKNLKENKIAIALVIVGLIIGGAIYITQKENLERENTQYEYEITSTTSSEEGDCHIHFTQAPKHIGEICIVEGKVDHVYISKKGNIFLDFCKNYKTCPFSGVIFKKDAAKFDPEIYEGREVRIKGLIKTYQGRPEIIINDPKQIEIK